MFRCHISKSLCELWDGTATQYYSLAALCIAVEILWGRVRTLPAPHTKTEQELDCWEKDHLGVFNAMSNINLLLKHFKYFAGKRCDVDTIQQHRVWVCILFYGIWNPALQSCLTTSTTSMNNTPSGERCSTPTRAQWIPSKEVEGLLFQDEQSGCCSFESKQLKD